jgi:hypothetical protein
VRGGRPGGRRDSNTTLALGSAADGIGPEPDPVTDTHRDPYDRGAEPDRDPDDYATGDPDYDRGADSHRDPDDYATGDPDYDRGADPHRHSDRHRDRDA